MADIILQFAKSDVELHQSLRALHSTGEIAMDEVEDSGFDHFGELVSMVVAISPPLVRCLREHIRKQRDIAIGLIGLATKAEIKTATSVFVRFNGQTLDLVKCSETDFEDTMKRIEKRK